MMQGQKNTWTLATLADTLGVEWRGDATLALHRLAPLGSAEAGSLSFLANPHYKHLLADTRASAVIVHPSLADECPASALISANPYLTYAHASRHFDNAPRPVPGVHPRAFVSEDVVLGNGVSVGVGAVVESGVSLADGVVIGPGCVVGAHSSLGEGTRLHANVTVYHGVRIGARCIVHSGVVIGADGFGFANDKGRWIKIAQVGGV